MALLHSDRLSFSITFQKAHSDFKQRSFEVLLDGLYAFCLVDVLLLFYQTTQKSVENPALKTSC
jgi:hypothetical protein